MGPTLSPHSPPVTFRRSHKKQRSPSRKRVMEVAKVPQIDAVPTTGPLPFVGLPRRGGKTSTPQYKATAPIHLFGSVVLKSGSPGSINAKAFVNPMGRPMEIFDLKFMLTVAGASANGSGVAVNAITGGAVGIQLDLGKAKLTNGVVPMWAFCKSKNYVAESGIFAVNDGALYLQCRLDQPLYIPAGMGLQPVLQHLGFTKQDITASVAISGRTILSSEPAPKEIVLPYCAAYVTKGFDAYGAADSDNSTELDLANPFETELLVHRIVGRTNIFVNSLPGSIEADITGATAASADYLGQLLTATMMSSRGEPIIPYPTTWNNIFPKATRAWECRHRMPPNTYYLMSVAKAAPTTPSVAALTGTSTVAILGSRRVAL